MSKRVSNLLPEDIRVVRPAPPLGPPVVPAPPPPPTPAPQVKSLVRTFDTGATRDTDEGKLDYEGFLSPLVLERYAQYMHKHRQQSDGTLRDSDNWQKGIPVTQYMKSLWRHFMAVWTGYRKGNPSEEDICAMLFNTMGLLHEMLNQKDHRIYMKSLQDALIKTHLELENELKKKSVKGK